MSCSALAGWAKHRALHRNMFSVPDGSPGLSAAAVQCCSTTLLLRRPVELRAAFRHRHGEEYQECSACACFLTANTEKHLAGVEDKPFLLPLLCWIRGIRSRTSYNSEFKWKISLSFLLNVSCYRRLSQQDTWGSDRTDSSTESEP